MLSACDGPRQGENPKTSLDRSVPQPQATSPTNIYWLLTAVQNGAPFSSTDEELASACETYLGFHRDMTTNRVISAREIRIPIQEEAQVSENIPVLRTRTVKSRPEDSGDIVYEENEKIIIDNDGYEERTIIKYIKGICIGSEYITE
jgi:hypothetical protein